MKSAVKIWRESKKRYENLGKLGRVLSFTKIIEAPLGFEGEAYWVVIVKLEKNLKTTGQLVGRKEPKIGSRVEGVLRRYNEAGDRQGVIEYGVKWKLR